jgi:hypothetical protein
VAEFLRGQSAPPAAQTQQQQTTPPRDEKTGRFTSTEQLTVTADEKATLLLQFQLGQIDAQTYLEQSGELADYFVKQGVPLNEIKAVVEGEKSRAFVASWSDASTAFLNSPMGADWPGGERNKNLLGMTIGNLGLIDAEDKIAALEQAYDYLKANGMLFEETPAGDAGAGDTANVDEAAFNKATNHEDLRALAHKSVGSSVFGR